MGPKISEKTSSELKNRNELTGMTEFIYDALGRRIREIDSVANKINAYYYNDNWSVRAGCEYEKK